MVRWVFLCFVCYIDYVHFFLVILNEFEKSGLVLLSGGFWRYVFSISLVVKGNVWCFSFVSFLFFDIRYTNWGGGIPHRPVEDIAFAVARFFQRGGSLMNYYMVCACVGCNILRWVAKCCLKYQIHCSLLLLTYFKYLQISVLWLNCLQLFVFLICSSGNTFQIFMKFRWKIP